MRKTISVSILTLAAAALAACGQSGKEGADARGSDTAQAAAPANPDAEAAKVAFQFQPGLYRTTINVQKVEMPGAPPQAAEQMKAMMARGHTAEHCMTAEQAAQGIEKMKEGMGKGKCTMEKFEASGGKVTSIFTCQMGEGMSMHSETTGTYSPTGSEVFIKADSALPGGRSMHLEQTVKSERIGDCKK